ncbi:MAG TPA: DUF3786 domain-containing protein [Syntrophorhabdaceae bacterium]|nr:DUF3786 domain-containing protein [Syntrophorhabdaceae bacterium]
MELKKQKVYKQVLDEACRAFLNSDQEIQLIKAGLKYKKTTKGFNIEIPYFNDLIILTTPDLSFKAKSGSNVNLVSKIIILHYLNSASGIPNSHELTPYEDIPGCRHYQPVFEKRVIKPLVSAFGTNRDAFREAGESLNGTIEDYGDASFTIWPLPKIPITFILWEADEEFPPSVRVLFDTTINFYIPLEDITIISKLASSRIIKAARINYAEEF